MKKYLRKSLFIIPLFIVLGFSQLSSNNRYFEISKSLELYSEVYKQVIEYYVDDVNPNVLMETGMNEMLKTLDPYTAYIPIERVEEAATEQGDQYAGIGTTLIFKDGKTIIDMVPEDSEAMRSGLETGDVIEAVGSVSIIDMDPVEVNLLIKGQANTNIDLTIRKYGSANPVKITLPRKKIERKSVPSHIMLPGNVGYVKLSIFNYSAGREVKLAVESLIDDGAEGIILDLRGNGGGLLNEAVNIVNIFTPRGKEVVTTRGKIVENNITYRTLSSPTDTEIPLVVLVDSGSASASEIVSGTIQDYDRGVILGTKSFGKGLVQVFLPLSYNAQLKVTSAKYYTPSGRCIQALDYSNRRADGSVGNVPDSLKQAFFTENGRVVYDGGGVDPDVIMPDQPLPPIVKSLISDLYIFDFATEFYQENESIPGPREFSINDRLLNDFTSWTRNKGFSYKTELEKEIDKFSKLAEEEKYIDYIQESIESVNSELAEVKDKDIDRHKELIRLELLKEITKRYYYEKGVVESTLDNDKWIEAAVDIIKDKQRYTEILGNL